MKRSYELLIAEHLQSGGFITNIKDAINHMSKGGYSYGLYERNSSDSFYVVTVIVSEKILIIYSIGSIDEEVDLITTVGL